MQNLRLLIGPDRLKVDSEEISAVSINYSLKDVKNYGQINSSYSKSITILHTKNTDRIFKGIFNVNSYGGFDPGVKVYGELEEDSVTILKGTLQLINAGINYYEVVLYANTVSIFAEIGDKLIIGNTDVNDDLQFDPSLFYHNWSRSKVREMLSVDPSKDGTGYCYPIINYDNKITWPYNLDFNPLFPDRLTDDYLIFPAVAAKQIFDKIFEENNYTYVVSPEIEQILKELYIPFNEEYLNRTTNWLYSKVYLGNPTDCSYTDTTVELGAIPFGSWFTSQVIPINSVKGFTFEDNYLPDPSNHVSGGFDYMHNYPSNWKKFDGEWYATTYYIELPHAGNYTIDVSMWLYNTAGASGSTEWSITTWNSIDGNVAYNIGDLDLNAHTGGYLAGSVNVAVSEKSSLAIHRSTGSSTSINLIFGPWSYITITENNSFIGGNTYFELNNMLPRNYKQKDFINDILKIFNAYVYVDEIDERKLYIKTHAEFYSEGKVYDWTNKMAKNANLKHRPLKNTFAKTTTISFTDDNDIYSQDYLSKYPTGIYSERVFNDSEFSAEQNEIKLSCSQGVITFIPGSNAAFSRYTTRKPDGVHALVISDDKTFKTAYKPRILFSNTVDISTHLYGSDSSTLGFTKWTTLSPRRYVDPSAENNVFLGFDSKNTYASVLTECNRNLYNLYYKSDIESNIGDDARILEGEFELNANDIHEVKFNDKIWIADPEIGNAYYRLNAIKDYNPGLGSERQLTKVELIKINLIDDSYSDVISTERIYKSTIGGTTTGTSSSSSSAPSSGGGGGTLQEVTDAGNITNNDIVLQNATEPTSQIALGANEDDELTIDGVSIEDKFMHQIETGNHFLISSADGDASISDAFIFDDASVSIRKNYIFFGDGNPKNDLVIEPETNKTVYIKGGSTLTSGNAQDFYVEGGSGASLGGNLILRGGHGGLKAGNVIIGGNTGGSELSLITIGGGTADPAIGIAKRIDLTIDTSLQADRKLILDNQYSHTPFVSGFTGDGYQLTKQSDGDYRLEIDDLYVRGSLTAYEFILNKIRANNGALWVSAAVEAVWPGNSSTPQPAGLFWDADVSCMYFTCEIGNNTLDTDDIIRSQQFTGAGIYQLEYKVYDVSTSRVYVVNLDDSSAAYVDVTDKTFVRVGNVSNTDRQGALYLTASDTNSPYMEILNDMSSNTIDQYHRKVRLGKLNGLNWNDISIGGYGLYSQNAYLTGGILANFGKIGNFEIQDGLLKGTGTAGDTITLNPDLPSIILSDASGGIVAHFTNEPILAIDDIQEGTELSYVGGDAGQYTAITWKYNQNLSGYYSGPYTLNPSIYIDNKYTYNRALEASTGKKGAQYALQTNAGTRFNTNMYVNINLAYTLPESSTLTWEGKPPEIPTTEGETVTTNVYTFGGNWSVNASTFFYDGSNNLLGAATVGTTSGLTGNKTNWQVVANKSIIANDTSTYIVFKPKISNGLYLNETQKIWVSYEPYPGYYEWQEVYSTNYQRDISANFTVDVETLTMNGAFQMTQIGQDGILTYWDDTKYFTVNNRESPLIQSAGGWYHYLASGQLMKFQGPNSSASNSYLYTFSGYEAEPVMVIKNQYAHPNGWGILLQSGRYDAGYSHSGNLMMFYDASGNWMNGKIYHNNTNTYYYGYEQNPSDEKLKKNIEDTKVDALKTLNSLKVRDFTWKKDEIKDTGFIAQEMEAVLPECVIGEEEKGILPTKLIPLLVKAVQQLSERVELLENKLKDKE